MAESTKIPSVNQVKNRTVKSMRGLGIYRREYDEVIRIYADMIHEYYTLRSQLESGGFRITEKYTNKAGHTNERKTPEYQAMENLRRDIAAYSDRLCLNAKAAAKRITEEDKKSTLEDVLSSLVK